MLVHLHVAAGVIAAVAIRRDLEAVTAEGDGVVVGHGARVLEAEHGVRIHSVGPGAVGGIRLGRLDSEAGVEAGPEFKQEAIGLLESAGPGEPQLLDQAILERSEEAFNASLGLRRVGGDELDAQLVHQAPKLAPLGSSPVNSCSRVAGLGLWKMVWRSA